MRLLIILFTCLQISFSQEVNYTILISFDGFRWDYLNRGITPNLDKLKANGVSAESLVPVFPTKTFPNHYTMVTGLYPDNHGIILNEFRDIKTNEIYRIWDTNQVTNPKWYKGETIWEIAKKQNIISASYFWPGSELKDITRQPNYFEKYEHTRPYERRVEGVLNWLQLPIERRPKIITMYFDATDSKGHRYGPNSKEVNDAISKLDSIVGSLVEGLEKLNLLSKTNLIITADHGMTEVSKNRIEKIYNLVDKDVMLEWSEAFLFVWPKSDKVDEVYSLLKSKESHFTTFKRDEIFMKYNFGKNEFIPPIVLVADLGWILAAKEPTEKELERFLIGNHGFKNNEKDMHGIFVASGPSFKKNFQTKILRTIDIFSVLCKISNLNPPKNIDSDIKKIEHILIEN
ncbi:MAG: ectonucleotide pyrophosphatase/phosphodiesterase [Bacteroidetes bacterium]|nr:ectonucleotide pyrophosphatase/phosphodiesterase [Bacteroidota bacterium]